MKKTPMKIIATLLCCALLVPALMAFAQQPTEQQEAKEAEKTVDRIVVVPNGYKGPIFVSEGRIVLPEFASRQENTYTTIIVDEDGEAARIGDFDTVPRWHYPRTVVQRNGLRVKHSGEEGVADDDAAFWEIGGYGPWKRSYRPGGFSAYFIGTKAEADTFRAELKKLVHGQAPRADG